MAHQINRRRSNSRPPPHPGFYEKALIYERQLNNGSRERFLTQRGGRMFLALAGSAILAITLAIANSSDGSATASPAAVMASTDQTPVMTKTSPPEPTPIETDDPTEKKLVSEFDQEELANYIANFASGFEGLGEEYAETLPDGTILYTAYPDPALGEEKPTICYGHTRNVQMGQKATLAQCQAYRKQDVEELVMPGLKRIPIRINKNQAIAFGDAFYNLGDGILDANRSFGGFIWNGDIDNAIESLDLYNRANGAKYAGLVTRRNAEQKLAKSILNSDEAIKFALANNP